MMGGWNYGYNNMMDGGWVGWLLMLIFGVLVVVGIVVLIIWAARQSAGHAVGGGSAPPSARAEHDEAIAIAKRRLASGEITKDQYDDIMKALG